VVTQNCRWRTQAIRRTPPESTNRYRSRLPSGVSKTTASLRERWVCCWVQRESCEISIARGRTVLTDSTV